MITSKRNNFKTEFSIFSRNFHIKTTLFNTFNYMCKNNGQNSFQITKNLCLNTRKKTMICHHSIMDKKKSYQIDTTFCDFVR